MGKGEIAGYEQFLFSQCFQKACFPGASKGVIVWEWVKDRNNMYCSVTVVQILPIPKQALVFTCLQYMSYESTAGKGAIARNEQLLLFPQCFQPVWSTFCHFHQILHTFSVWKSLKFVVWERVKPFTIQNFNNPKEEKFWNQYVKGKDTGTQHFLIH